MERGREEGMDLHTCARESKGPSSTERQGGAAWAGLEDSLKNGRDRPDWDGGKGITPRSHYLINKKNSKKEIAVDTTGQAEDVYTLFTPAARWRTPGIPPLKG